MMRIITGKARGVRLKTLDSNATRPTAERTKEAVFSSLQFDIQHRTVLDLFAGSGQMGLEAVSRGASRADFVDVSEAACGIIRENIALTRLDGNCRVFCRKAQDFLKTGTNETYGLVFLDPPYASGLIPEVLETLVSQHRLDRDALVVIETGEDFEPDPGLPFETVKRNKYGLNHILILRYKEGKS